MAGDDAELVALIDNELDEEARGHLLARLEEDQVLRKRCERLRETGAPIAASLDALIDDAPLPGCAARCRRWARPALAAGRSAELPFAISRRDLLSAC
jgi:anti-sigma factor RsiW